MLKLSSIKETKMSPAEPAAATTLGTDSALSLEASPIIPEIERALIEGVQGAERQIAARLTYLQRETDPAAEVSRFNDSTVVGRTSDYSVSSPPEVGDGTKADPGNNILPGPGAILYRANVA